MVMRLPGISVAKCTAEYHRDKNITLRVSYGRKVNVNVEEGAAMKKGAGSKDSEVRQDAARVSTNSSHSSAVCRAGRD